MDVGSLDIVQGINLGRLNEILSISLFSNLSLDITPDERTILSEVVTLIVPSGLAAPSRGCGTQGLVYVTQILDMHLMPNILALADEEALTALKNRRTQPVGLYTLGVAGTTARAIDSRGQTIAVRTLDGSRLPISIIILSTLR
jgi:hypothetical protein